MCDYRWSSFMPTMLAVAGYRGTSTIASTWALFVTGFVTCCVHCVSTVLMAVAQTDASPSPVSVSAQPTLYPAEMPADAAASVFERKINQLRRQQRSALARQAHSILAELEEHQKSWLQSGPETKESLDAWRSVAETWRIASDLPTAVTLTFPLRSQLSQANQKRLMTVIDQLSGHIGDYRQAKLDYQHYLAVQLVKRWDSLTLLQKRGQLQSYYFLDGQRPEWLQMHRPVMAPLPFQRSAKDRLRLFETKRDEFLAKAQTQFQPQVQLLIERLGNLARRGDLEGRQLRAIGELTDLLSSDYGHGFRGLMLCEVASDLPEVAATPTREFLDRYQQAVQAWQVQHRQLTDELKSSLEPFREELLQRHNFSELMAIDIAISEKADFLKPIRIYASRSPTSGAPEDCHLLNVDQRGYLVEFLRDTRRRWLPRDLVHLKPSSIAPPYPLLSAPDDSPGELLEDASDLSGSFVCYTPGGWQSCKPLDVSPFGMVIQFDDLLEPVFPIVPRSCVRRTRP